MIPTPTSAALALASLPWYDLKEVRPATDALWRALCRRLRRLGLCDVPERLNRRLHYERQWTSPGFLFGQACGYDARVAFARRLKVVATPRYDAPGCVGSRYRSFIVAPEDAPYERLEDLRGARCAINTPTSHSGMNSLRALVAPLSRRGRFFSSVLVSGSHERSLRLIRRGKADVAAIDCVTYALLARHRPSELDGARVLFRTPTAPAPPFVTSARTPADAMEGIREAVFETFDDPSLRSVRQSLLLCGVEVLPEDAYREIETLESLAMGRSYRELP